MQIKLNSSKLNYKVDTKKVLENLFDFKLASCATEILKISKTKESKAFELLFNVTQKTNVELSKELGQEKINKATKLSVTFNEIEMQWKDYFQHEIIITDEFFKNIIQHNPKYLTKSYALFEKYLSLLNIVVSQNYYYKYYNRFRDNLLEEFSMNKEKYQLLVDYFNNPLESENASFKNQIEHYLTINEYYTSKLQAEVEDSNETLQDLYIDPNFKIYKNNLIDKKSTDDFLDPAENISVHEFLNNYFLKDRNFPNLRENYNMLFVLGQPGQGKTPFCYRLLHDILNESNGLPEKPLFFIKIRDLVAKDFIDDTFNTINNHISQNFDFKKENVC